MGLMQAFCLRVNFTLAAYFWKISCLEETGKRSVNSGAEQVAVTRAYKSGPKFVCEHPCGGAIVLEG